MCTKKNSANQLKIPLIFIIIIVLQFLREGIHDFFLTYFHIKKKFSNKFVNSYTKKK